MKKNKKAPKLKSNTEAAEFWEEHDSTEYVDWSKAKLASFPNLKPSTKTISLRLPESVLNDVKILAHKEDIPYQSLIKLFIIHGLKKSQ